MDASQKVNHKMGKGNLQYNLSEYKKIHELRRSDLLAHPVWSWAELDEDESCVMPVEISDFLPEDDHDSLFILSEFILADGAHIGGAIAVHMGSHIQYRTPFHFENGEPL